MTDGGMSRESPSMNEAHMVLSALKMLLPRMMYRKSRCVAPAIEAVGVGGITRIALTDEAGGSDKTSAQPAQQTD